MKIHSHDENLCRDWVDRRNLSLKDPENSTSLMYDGIVLYVIEYSRHVNHFRRRMEILHLSHNSHHHLTGYSIINGASEHKMSQST